MVGAVSHRESFTGADTLGNIPKIYRNQYIYGHFSQIHKEHIFDFFEKESYVKNIHMIYNILDFPLKTAAYLCDALKSEQNTVYIRDSYIYIFANRDMQKKISNQCLFYEKSKTGEK